MFSKKYFLQTCSKYTKEHPCRSVISVKLQTKFYEITLLTSKFAAYFQNSCFDEHQWGTNSLNFYSTCLRYFSIQIRFKFGFFSNIFLTSSMFSSERAVLRLPAFSFFFFRLVPCERYFVRFCWIIFLQGGA